MFITLKKHKAETDILREQRNRWVDKCSEAENQATALALDLAAAHKKAKADEETYLRMSEKLSAKSAQIDNLEWQISRLKAANAELEAEVKRLSGFRKKVLGNLDLDPQRARERSLKSAATLRAKKAVQAEADLPMTKRHCAAILSGVSPCGRQ